MEEVRQARTAAPKHDVVDQDVGAVPKFELLMPFYPVLEQLFTLCEGLFLSVLIILVVQLAIQSLYHRGVLYEMLVSREDHGEDA